MDLGECPKIHDLALRADFEKAQQTKDYFYDLDVSRFLFVCYARNTDTCKISGDGTFGSVYRRLR